MNRVSLDKVASVAKNAGVEREVYLGDEIVSQEGYVVAVEVLNDKAVYNLLENAHGRMMRLKPGDRIAGVLGRRRASLGYSGDIPETLKVGDRIHVLNAGGVLGLCRSYAPSVGAPFEVRVLGAVLHFPYLGERVGEPAHIGLGAIKAAAEVDGSAPILAVVGTCMNSGKTVAACELIHGLTRRGLTVAGAKVTGVALQRDLLGMVDHGASEALSFNDAGLPSTTPESAPPAARRIIAQLNLAHPDAIVVEFGDGLLGEYGVQGILSDPQVADQIRFVVLAANDPVGAFGGVALLRERYGLETGMVIGPVTDNAVGREFIERELGVPAANALTSPEALVAAAHREVFENDQPQG